MGPQEHDSQAQALRDYLDFELTNPQRLEAAPLAQRIKLAYDQALMHLRYYPEVGGQGCGGERACICVRMDGGGVVVCVVVGGA
jgi:hypothetical protein